MGTFVGFYQIIDFIKCNKSSTHLHNNKIVYYTHPKVIPWGQKNKWTNKQRDRQTDGWKNGQIFIQYSRMSSHSLRGVWIGKGQVAGGHVVDVAHFCKCSHPMILPVVPHMVKEGTTFPLSPCECHVPKVESMLGSSCYHHFLGDGHTCVLCKSLALLLLACVDGKWKVGIDSLVEIGDVVVEIRKADLRGSSVDVGDKLL